MTQQIPEHLNPVLWRERIAFQRIGRFKSIFRFLYGGVAITTILLGFAYRITSLVTIYLIFDASTYLRHPYTPLQSMWSDFGLIVIVLIFSMQGLILLFFVPPLVAGSIAEERKRGTLDILFTTPLSLKSLLDGKLRAAVPHVLILVALVGVLTLFALPARDIYIASLLLAQLIMATMALFLLVGTLYVSTFFIETTSVLGTVYGGFIVIMIASGILVYLLSDEWRVMEEYIAFGISLPVAVLYVIMAHGTEAYFLPAIIAPTVYGSLSYLLYRGTLRRMKYISNR